MDRDKRWERIKMAYDLMVNGKGEKSTNLLASIQKSYDNGVTDEFIKPIVSVDEKGNPISYAECDIVLTYELKQTFQSKALYEFNPSSDDINSLSDETIKSEDEDEDENVDSLQF